MLRYWQNVVKSKFFWAVVFCLAAVLIYLPAARGGFIWDDESQILNNSAVHSVSRIPSLFTQSTFFAGEGARLEGIFYRPLMMTAFALIYAVIGPHAWLFHLSQILLHGINAFLVFLIFTALFKRRSLAAVLALVFLVHPIQAEAVAYIADFQDVLFVMFGLLGLLGLIRLKSDWQACTAACAGALCASVSKETGLLFLPLMLLYTVLLRRRTAVLLVSGLASIATVYVSLRCFTAHLCYGVHGVSPIMQLPFPIRLLHIPRILETYLVTFLFPARLTVAQHWVIHRAGAAEFYLPAVVSFLGFSVLLSLVLTAPRGTKPAAWFFFLWIGAGVGMHLHFIPLDFTAADRWMYLPTIGILGLLATHLTRLRFTPTVNALILVLILVLSGRTALRAYQWSRPLWLFSSDGQYSTNAFDLETNWGVELFRSGNEDESLRHFARAAALAPRSAIASLNLGIMYERRGDYRLAKACYERAAANGPYYLAYHNYAHLLVQMGETDTARRFLKEAIKHYPQDAELLQYYKQVQ